MAVIFIYCLLMHSLVLRTSSQEVFLAPLLLFILKVSFGVNSIIIVWWFFIILDYGKGCILFMEELCIEHYSSKLIENLKSVLIISYIGKYFKTGFCVTNS